MIKRKLIEVALPLDAINAAATYEKMPGIGPHPRGIHLWWARRPLAAARAVIFASLVDDPSSRPDLFPTEEAQNVERKRLFGLIEELVKWENSNNEIVLDAAKAEIMKSTDGNPPELLDPFAGGGAIPLEGQRLGLKAHASDLNPVAVMINKAMIEMPPRFANMPPVNPDSRKKMASQVAYNGASGLAEDVRYYGEWMKQEAWKRIGHLYPKVKVPEEQGGGEATVIAWIWARTVKCPNPACGCEMPLVKSFELSRKKGREAFVQPIIEANGTVRYEVKQGKGAPEGTVARSGAKCICCEAPVGLPYIREEGQAKKLGSQLIAIVAEGKNGKRYYSSNNQHVLAALVDKPLEYPSGKLSGKARVSAPLYGFDETSDLFTNRQLVVLTTISDLVHEVQKKAKVDAITAGLKNDRIPLENNGDGATAYGQAIGVFLSFSLDRLADFSTSVSRWAPTNEKAMNCFSKQAIAMTWDYPEVNILGNSVGGLVPIIDYISQCILTLPTGQEGVASQFDAQSDIGLRNVMVSTDPPYYDNISYADLSDFFYVWMRKSLKETYPKLFRTMLVPKSEELIATPYRFSGDTRKARDFFEDGMLRAFKQLYTYARTDIPVTIYYAFKQNETIVDKKNEKHTASTGWETMLTALIHSGFLITGTWPMRTEQVYRSVGMNANALASSIVLVCRKRSEDAAVSTRRDFVNTLNRELKPALKELQRSNIAPVDLAQSAIGPGMAVFSRYSAVLDADGSPMSVRSALQIINRELDLYFSEQDGDLDRDSRFCVELYSQFAFNTLKFGEADVLARAKNTSVEKLVSRGVLFAQKGDVHLLTRDELPERVNASESIIWLLTQQLTRAMETGGIKACAQILKDDYGTNTELAKALAYRLFTIAESKHWAQEAYAYNSLIIAWPDIQLEAAKLRSIPEQMSLEDIQNREA